MDDSASTGSPGHILSQASRAVAIILSIVQILKVVELQLLLERQVVELPAQSELAVDFFLADTKVLDIEETDVLGSIGELLGQLFLATRSIEQTQIESDELSPVHWILMLAVFLLATLSGTHNPPWSPGLACMVKGWRQA